MFWYLDKDQLLVLLQVQGCIDIRGDPFHLLGVSIVQHKHCILPHFIAWNREKNTPLSSGLTAGEQDVYTQVMDNRCTFKKVGFVGSLRVHSSIQVSGESSPQLVNLYWFVVSHIRDRPHVITTESEGFPPWTWLNIQWLTKTFVTNLVVLKNNVSVWCFSKYWCWCPFRKMNIITTPSLHTGGEQNNVNHY